MVTRIDFLTLVAQDLQGHWEEIYKSMELSCIKFFFFFEDDPISN